MSKGTQIYSLRIPSSMMIDIQQSIIQANETRKEEPYTMTTWIHAAIREKIAHLKRSRKKNHDSVPHKPEAVQDNEPVQGDEPQTADVVDCWKANRLGDTAYCPPKEG